MIKWKKILIDRSNKIKKITELKNFDVFSKEVETEGYISNENYINKKKFFEFYLKDRYLIWHDHLKGNLNTKDKILSIASGRGINELVLISNNFNITCSDLEIPHCYEISKKLFGDFNYLKLNILKDNIEDKFNSIFCISALYIFSDQEVNKAFKNFYKILENDGTLIIDHGGTQDNAISFFFHEIFLFFEAYIVYYLSKIINKKIGFTFDYNFGYRRKNREIIKLANICGFELVDIKSYDYLTELNRSVLIRKVIEYLPFTKKVFSFVGRSMPYIRMFKFKKIMLKE
tara:strand:- start:306 stop:1169 length:864 start_codon:yes stop_codon:yes gene_type:complete